MAIDPTNAPAGPIPGENYTSNTKNYAWHRPPDITDMDEAIEHSIKHMSVFENTLGILNSLEIGMPVAKLAELFVISGIGKGKWTPDFAILLAGPVAKMIEIIAKNAKVEYNMGLDTPTPSTSKYYKALAEDKKPKEITKEQATAASEGLQNEAASIEAPKQMGGFMGGMSE